MNRTSKDYEKLNMLCAKSVGMKNGGNLHRGQYISRL